MAPGSRRVPVSAKTISRSAGYPASHSGAGDFIDMGSGVGLYLRPLRAKQQVTEPLSIAEARVAVGCRSNA